MPDQITALYLYSQPDSVVRLFHWEMECYLVSGGSFASMEDTEADVKGKETK